MTAENIEFRRATDIDEVLSLLIDIYATVRADLLHDPHYSVERYSERLARHAAEPGWEAIIGFDGDQAVGYAYANTVQPHDRWWRRMSAPLPQSVMERPTIALKEGMLLPRWRGRGLARAGHDELLATRPEEQVMLMVNPQAGGGKVKALYEGWGYREVSSQQPSMDGPVLTAMLRAIRQPAASADTGH
ncbi:GNAT family N-acetyltransferase [Streptomyces sp. XM4011]|uniref:GNAT family N-acetyltransferase n=1 Tax=Streptomyces sp. XM4011 TaxID=2929780 RepID=UPI001FFB552E|nr:GNAT family N-acetyltransferase [Streptomyces sp. XM4011]MCK1813223.1 GNAT family N-acetyltransferase [Streptomyces sp. XM4011]